VQVIISINSFLSEIWTILSIANTCFKSQEIYVKLSTWRPTVQFPLGAMLVGDTIEQPSCFCSECITCTEASVDDCSSWFAITGNADILGVGSSWLQALASWKPTTLVAFHSKWHSSTLHMFLNRLCKNWLQVYISQRTSPSSSHTDEDSNMIYFIREGDGRIHVQEGGGHVALRTVCYDYCLSKIYTTDLHYNWHYTNWKWFSLWLHSAELQIRACKLPSQSKINEYNQFNNKPTTY
jgi:hypothetical protein